MSLTSRVPSGADSAGFVPTIWSKIALDAVHDNLVCVPLFDTQYEAELKKGDTINIPILNTISASEVVVGTHTSSNAADPMTGSKKSITIDKWYEAPVMFDEMTNLQSQVNVMEKGAQEAAYAIAVQMDTSVNSLFSSLGGGTVKGTDGAAITDDTILDAMEYLDENSVPQDGRSLILDPSGKRDMLEVDKFIRQDYTGKGPVATGRFGQVYNCGVFITNNLTSATTGAYACMAHKKAIGIIVQDGIKATRFHEPWYHRYTVNSEALWGLAELRDTFGVAIYTRKA